MPFWMRQRTMPRSAPSSYSGAPKRSSTKGGLSRTTRRSVRVYSTRIRPSVTRERNFQYVRARRSRCSGSQIASSSAAGISTSAAWIERTAPLASMTVCSSGSAITASAIRRCCGRLSSFIAVRSMIPPAAVRGGADNPRRPGARFPSVVRALPIKEVAEQTGLAAGTIRMWEQRYGFPDPARTPSGYRVYSPGEVEALRRVVAYRDSGLSVPAALERAKAVLGPTDRPSIFGAIMARAPVRAHVLRKPTLVALSRAIEDEALALAAGPVVVAAFQGEANFRAVEHRYRRLARTAD